MTRHFLCGIACADIGLSTAQLADIVWPGNEFYLSSNNDNIPYKPAQPDR